jgi:tetratricopeptide (TPR) repeat protein
VANLARLSAAASVSIGAGAGLWAVLQPGFGVDPAISAGSAAGLAAVVAAFGAVWAPQSPSDPPPGHEAQGVPDTGTLERVATFFTDRTDEWAGIQAKVRLAATRKQTCAAFMIYGMPGVGKSEFAKFAANEFVAEFSEYVKRDDLDMLARQVELHGLEGLERTEPEDALRALLPDGDNPRISAMNLDQLSAEWRKQLHGKFLILLLNNAEDESQILPFLPGGSSYIVLITSRRSLPGLIGKVLASYRLEVLDMASAVQMIRSVTGRPLGENGKENPIEEQAAIEGIARLCEYLPLAIWMAVSELAEKSDIKFADRLAQLEAAPSLLLEIDEYVGKGRDGVIRSFERSYEQLSDASRNLLRLLGLPPVPAISIEAASALANIPFDVARSNLREAEKEALITKNRDGSYEMHDLIRRYARSLAGRDDPAKNEAAVKRLFDYYLGALCYIDSILTRQQPPQSIDLPVPTVTHDFVDPPSAIAWARVELTNLLACADYIVRNAESAGGREEKARAILFIGGLAGLLRNDGLWDRSIGFQTQAINVGEQLHVPLAVANALSERALLYRLTGQLEAAVIDLDRAIAIYREIGGSAGGTGEAHALNTYGVVLDQRKDQVKGRQRLSEALSIHRRLNNPLGEANVLHDQGMAEFFAKNDDAATQLLSEALTLYASIDHPLGMAHAYYNLGRAQQRVGSEDAEGNFELARLAYQNLGNKLGEINVLIQLGAVLRDHHNFSRAAEVLDEAIGKSVEIGSQLGLVNSLYERGELYKTMRKRKAALAAWARALETAREHGLEREEARLEAALASGHDRTGFVARWRR